MTCGVFRCFGGTWCISVFTLTPPGLGYLVVVQNGSGSVVPSTALTSDDLDTQMNILYLLLKLY